MKNITLCILSLILALSLPLNACAWVTIVPKEELYNTVRSDSKTVNNRKKTFKDKGLPASIVEDPVSYAMPDRINIKLNGEYRYFYDEPMIVEGRVLLPFRELFEFFGMEVSWDEESYTAKAVSSGNEITITVNNEKAYVNGEEKILDVPATIINSRAYVPIRFVGESLGFIVRWDSDERTVVLSGGAK